VSAVSRGPNLGFERGEGGGLADGRVVSPGAQVEEPHVEVATRSCELAEPPEVCGEGGNRLLRQNSPKLTEGRSGAAGGDPQVVERIGAAVVDREADRSAKRGAKLQQDSVHCLACGLVGFEVHDFVFAFTPGARSRGVGENREGGVGKSEIRNPKSEISYATFASAFLSAFVSVLGVLFLAPSESLAAGAGLSFSLGREPLPLP